MDGKSGIDQPRIREALPQDLDALLDIYNQARAGVASFRIPCTDARGLRALLEGEEILVAETEAGILGFIGLWLPQRFIHHLYVLPEFQGRGLGRLLVQACIQRFGLPLSLKCQTGNRRAIDFYLRSGWEIGEGGLSEEGPWVWMWLRAAPETDQFSAARDSA